MQKIIIKCYTIYVVKNFKDILFLIIVLIIVVLLGYWAVITIESGSVHVQKQKQQELEQKNKELEQEIGQLKNEIMDLQLKQEKTSIKEEVQQPNTTVKTVSKYQSLIDDLQKLIDAKVSMKENSKGTRVGIVQTFLNIYNNTSKKIDNNYGKGTKTDVINFQKKEGLIADGEAGLSTFRKMIDWLKKQ